MLIVFSNAKTFTVSLTGEFTSLESLPDIQPGASLNLKVENTHLSGFTPGRMEQRRVI